METQLELFFDFDLRDITVKNTKVFDDYASLLHYSLKNPDKKIYLTRTQTLDFCEDENKIVVNLDRYQEFCKTIGQNGKNRTQAFLAQKIKNYSEAEKKQIVASTTEEEILERVKNFTPSGKQTFLDKLSSIEGLSLPQISAENISNEEFLKAFGNFMKDPAKHQLILSNYSQIQVGVLEEHKEFLENNLDKTETFLQHWIDGKIDKDGNEINLPEEEVKKIRQSRCLIFGLEFIGHKSQGIVNSKRFDILTRVSEDKNDYVLIELKGPTSDVFERKVTTNINGGSSEEYSLSSDISRAIPQIAEYRNNLEEGSEIDWQRIGLPKGRISKCIIIIGVKNERDFLWQSHYHSLRRNLISSIDIMTYTDLISKLDITIKNLKENLK
jgi:hypothetical protein